MRSTLTERASGALGDQRPTLERLARRLDTNPSRHTEKVEPRRASEERLLELKAVVDLLRRVMRDDAARLWLRSPNPDLSYEKPLDLIGTGEYQRVIDLLLALAEGVAT